MKKLFGIFGAALVLAGVSLAAEKTVTNLNEVITVRTYDELVAATKKVKIYEDASKYANKVGEQGSIVRFYDFDVQGGAVGDVTLYPPIAVPAGAIIRNGLIRVSTPTDVDTPTVALKITGAGDLLAATTNLSAAATATLATVPVGTAATSVRVTSDSYVKATIASGALTKGKFMVVLDYVLGP